MDLDLLLTDVDDVLLAQVLEDQGFSNKIETIQPRNCCGPAPLSYAQQRLWFLQQLEPDSTNYNLLRSYRVDGVIDLVLLQQAFQMLVEHHQVLASIFDEDEGEPYQQFSTQQVEVHCVDICHLTTEQQILQLQRLKRQEAERAFNLKVDLPIRVSVILLTKQNACLLLNLHHIVTDAWSTDILLQDFVACYRAVLLGKETTLPPLSVQYSDYAVWQKQWLTGDTLNRQLDYWSGYLSGCPLAIELPTNLPRPSVQSNAGDLVEFKLPPRLADQLAVNCQQLNISPFAVFMSAWQILLWRYSSQQDFLVGVPNANRHRVEVEELVGCFINTQVFRAELSGELTCAEVVEKVAGDNVHAQNYQDLPFDLLVETLVVNRDSSRTPLFQVMFNFQAITNKSPGSLSLPGISFEGEPELTGSSKFDLTLNIYSKADGFIGDIEYCTALFNQETIKQIIRHYIHLLDVMVSQPDTRLCNLQLLDQTERDELAQVESLSADYGLADSWLNRFAEQVQSKPESIVVSDDQGEMTFAELDGLSSQVAASLQQTGVGPDDVVAILAERNRGFIVSLVGILKAGAAWLPLSPTQPAARWQQVLDGAQVKAVLADEQHLAEVEQALPKGAPVLNYQSLLAGKGEYTQVTEQPGQLAYVLFTSGSTGTPKGVMVSREGMLNNMLAKVTPLGLSETDVIAQTAGQCFDICVWQMLTAPILGCRVHIVDEETVRDPQGLTASLNQQGVTITELVPSLLQAVLETETDTLTSLRWVLPTGEALPPALATSWFSHYPHIPLMNAYGPAECADDVAFAPLYAAPDESVVNMPIGLPTANASLYVVDDALNRVPTGVVGELAVGGVGVGRGYREEPGKTAALFVPNPFSDKGERLYLTGDLVKRGADGQLEYIGRKDFQVKIRGQRIELGEIEAALEKQGGVKQAVVTASEVGSSQHLVAYISGDAAADSELKQQLSEVLPGYMVPSLIVRLAQLPLSSNGKVDRKALPAPDFSAVQKQYQAPETETEYRLAVIWQELLQVEQVGRTDNFFELGGHSLLATRLVSQIERQMGKQLSLISVFETPTLMSQAQALEESEESRLPALVKVPRSDRMPLSFAQQRMWMLEQLEGGQTYLMPGALKLEGQLDVKALEQSFSDLVERHEALRTRIVVEAGESYQCIDEAQAFSLGYDDLSESATKEGQLATLIEGNAREVFDLSQAPLFRARLVKLNEGEHVLLYALHHIIGDEWSGQLLIEEMSQAYSSRLSGYAPQWPVLDVQYVDYAVWQREWLQGEVLELQLAYWRGELGEQHPVLELPYDYARPAAQSFAGDSIDFELSSELTGQLTSVCNKLSVTPYQFLLTGFQILLARYSGQERILVGTPIANRAKTELESVVGCFINTQVMKLDLNESDSGKVLLEQVKRFAIQAQQHRDVPFELLVETICGQRDPAITPLFQAMFNFIVSEQTDETADLPGLTATTIETSNPFAKFELLMTIEQGATYSGNLVYCADLFSRDTMEALVSAYQTLLQSFLANPGENWRKFALIGDMKAEEIQDFESSSDEFLFKQDIYQRFRSIALANSGKVAVIDKGERVFYDDLLFQVDNYASRLHHLGVSQGLRIAVMAQRRKEFVVGILAILKLGACYVPLEPTNPSERSEFILSDAGVSLLIAESQSEFNSLPKKCRFVPYSLLNETCINPVKEQKVEGLLAAYIMYTSGSTGQPKGVEVSQQGIARLATGGSLPVNASSRVLCASSLAFDAATFEIFASLLNGAALVLFPDEHINFSRLNSLIEREQINVAWMTAGLFDRYIEDTLSVPTSLRHLLVGGDTISVSSVKTASVKSQDLCLINGYGPTENTTFTTLSYDLINQVSRRSRLPIGKPISGTKVYVLDELHQRVPVGMPGELYTAGVGLAKGYINRDKLTNDKFVCLSCLGNETRLYRTGDKVRWLADGQLDFMGRADNQVKVRGYRIELEEIEQVLLSHSSIKEATVIVVGERAADKFIAAYIVFHTGYEWKSQQKIITDFISLNLPVFMRPSVLSELDALPLNNNGKVDKKSLPPAINQQGEHVHPIGDMERVIAEIWQEVLVIEQVGRTDNFFELGGHSLSAVSFMAKLSKKVGLDAPMKLLFQYPNLADLAWQLTNQNVIQSGTLLNLAADPKLPLLFMVHGGGGHVNHYRPLAEKLGNCYSVIGVQSRELVELDYQASSLQSMVEDYTQQIIEASKERAVNLMGWSDGCFISIGIERRLKGRGVSVDKLILVDGDMNRVNKLGFCGWKTCVENYPSLLLLPKKISNKAKEKFQANYKEGIDYLLSVPNALKYGVDVEVLRQKAYTLLDANYLLSGYEVLAPSTFFTLFLAERGYEIENENKWKVFGGGICDIRIVPGDHYSILNQPEFISEVTGSICVGD